MATSSPEQRKANVRLGLILATVALVFAIGFVVRLVYFGG
ncbi:MAG: cytochrome oxidase small assembly protein [Gammaproteobacteria bacterium]|nr:cytochrome oxidase small assembly protein [Azohydromonas sp.]HMM85412.1 cytochrome oxidase small assembly protein [Azohydromonas sp.]